MTTLSERRAAITDEDWSQICDLMEDGLHRREDMTPEWELEHYYRPLYARWCLEDADADTTRRS